MTKGADGTGPTVRFTGERHNNEVHICNRCHLAFNREVEDWGALRLKPLVTGSDEHLRFTTGDFKTLAAWCFKQAIILDLTERDPCIPEAHRQWFSERFTPPPNVAIWVGTLLSGGEWFHIRSRMTVLRTVDGGKSDLYGFAARAGEFFFQVIGIARGGSCDLQRRAADVTQIWPPSDASEEDWMPRPGRPMTTKRFIRAAHLSLELVD